jgi:hypothetical protein
MDESKYYPGTWKYSLLYGLVVVPLGGFIGFISCFGVSMAGSEALKLFRAAAPIAESGEIVTRNNYEPAGIFLGFAASFVIFIGGIYLSYRLGRDKAYAEANKLPPDAGGGQGGGL